MSAIWHTNYPSTILRKVHVIWNKFPGSPEAPLKALLPLSAFSPSPYKRICLTPSPSFRSFKGCFFLLYRLSSYVLSAIFMPAILPLPVQIRSGSHSLLPVPQGWIHPFLMTFSSPSLHTRLVSSTFPVYCFPLTSPCLFLFPFPFQGPARCPAFPRPLPVPLMLPCQPPCCFPVTPPAASLPVPLLPPCRPMPFTN